MVIEAMQTRKSVFAFSDKVIEDEKIKSLFEAAQLAASSMNLQPWRFIFAKHDEPEFHLILNTLAEGNQKWAKNASLLVLSIAQVEYSFNNAVYKNSYALHDTGMANAHLMLQAASLGIATHPMGGFDHNNAVEKFHLPKEYKPVLVIAAGYKGDESILPEDLSKRQSAPRKRKPINDVVFKGTINF